jgi:hypothetical protein
MIISVRKVPASIPITLLASVTVGEILFIPLPTRMADGMGGLRVTFVRKIFIFIVLKVPRKVGRRSWCALARSLYSDSFFNSKAIISSL